MNKNPLSCYQTDNSLELRMYGLVPYQLIGIQKAIQYGHSTDQYTAHIIEHIMNSFIDIDVRKKYYPYATSDESIVSTYIDWLKNWKTYIILNGGTTNTNPLRLGTLNKHLETLKLNGVFCSEFYEPDLGDQLTAITFIVDERVFNKEIYPNPQWMNDVEELERIKNTVFTQRERLDMLPNYNMDAVNEIRFSNFMDVSSEEDITNLLDKHSVPTTLYQSKLDEWIKTLGGQKNFFLRNFLKDFDLA
jgi:hypothetical protein